MEEFETEIIGGTQFLNCIDIDLLNPLIDVISTEVLELSQRMELAKSLHISQIHEKFFGYGDNQAKLDQSLTSLKMAILERQGSIQAMEMVLREKEKKFENLKEIAKEISEKRGLNLNCIYYDIIDKIRAVNELKTSYLMLINLFVKIFPHLDEEITKAGLRELNSQNEGLAMRLGDFVLEFVNNLP